MKIEVQPQQHVDLVAALSIAVGETVVVEYFKDKTSSGTGAFLLTTTDPLPSANPENGVYISPDSNSLKSVRGVTRVTGYNIGLYNTGDGVDYFSVYKD